MPSSLYHLKIAENISALHPFLYTSEFFLGAIAPDTVNLHGFASKELRWAAHKRAADLNEWTENIVAFYKDNCRNISKDFLTGYTVHVLTDIEADRMESEIHQRILKINPDCNKYEEYSRQIEYAENFQLDKDWWLYAKNKLLNAKGHDINGIKAEDIILWRNHVIESYAGRKWCSEGLITENDFDTVTRRVDDVLLKAGICVDFSDRCE